MKRVTLLVVLMLITNLFAQKGKMYLKSTDDSTKECVFVYETPKGEVLGAQPKVNFVYKAGELYLQKTVALIKAGEDYQFAFNFKSNEAYLIIATIADVSGEMDNNESKGYVVFLNTKSPQAVEQSKIDEVQLSSYANFVLHLNISPQVLLDKYEQLYKTYPKLKSGKTYLDYLIAKYQVKKEAVASELLAYASKKEKSEKEEDLIAAFEVYGVLRNEDKKGALKKVIFIKFPKGSLAQDYFFEDFYNKSDRDPAYIKSTFEQYMTRFNDHSDLINDRMNMELIRYYLGKNDRVNVDVYEQLMKDKTRIANLYNQKAWDLAGENLKSEGKDFEFAASLAQKALKIANEQLAVTEDKEYAQGQYNTYADTYALVLFKQKKYEEAFQYEDGVRQQDGLDTGGKERYATYAEYGKGGLFAKEYIEKELASGVNSNQLVDQLESLYVKLNLPMDQFHSIKAKATALAEENNRKNIIKEFGTTTAPNFSLTNLDGKKVQLSDLKGKLVVLDFWATWCGPCKASFPKMQELVTKYQDKNVVFLFVDTFEHKKAEDAFKKVNQFIQDKKYTFNVVFDYDDAVGNSYKVIYIPKKFVIDEKGNIIAVAISEESLDSLLEKRLKG